MPFILLSPAAFSARIQQLPKLMSFLYLTPSRSSLPTKRYGTTNEAYLTIGDISDGLRSNKFKMAGSVYLAEYYEKWRKDQNSSCWYLLSVYFHVYDDAQQIIALHCEPQEPLAPPKCLYKRGPHLHLSACTSSIAKAHIATNVSKIDAYETIDEVDAVLKQTLEMIKIELL